MSRGHAECWHEPDLSICESLHEYGHVAITTSLQAEITTSRCIPLSQGPFLDASHAPIAAVPPRAEIFLVVQFVAIFLSCPETTCVRDSRYDLDLSRSNNSNKDRQNSTKEKDEVEVGTTSRRGSSVNGRDPSPRRPSFSRSLFRHVQGPTLDAQDNIAGIRLHCNRLGTLCRSSCLRTLELRERLGRRRGPRADHVCIRRNVHFPVPTYSGFLGCLWMCTENTRAAGENDAICS